MASHMIITGRTSGQDYKAGFVWMSCPCSVTLSALHPAFCLCCIQKNIAGYFVRSELFVIFARRFPYENINISYEENIIFH